MSRNTVFRLAVVREKEDSGQSIRTGGKPEVRGIKRKQIYCCGAVLTF